MTEDEMVGWRHWLSGHEFEQTPRDSQGQGSLVCIGPWGCKESDTTWPLNNRRRKSCSGETCPLILLQQHRVHWENHLHSHLVPLWTGSENTKWPPITGLWSGGSGTKLLTLIRFQKEPTYSPVLSALTPCRKQGSYKQGSWWGAPPTSASSRAHCQLGP